MEQGAALTAIAHQIQLAIAPVFLLTGIGAILSVLTSRLARTVERSRSLARDLGAFDEDRRRLATSELALLDRRIAAVNLAISACTAAALFVCILIALIFVANLVVIPFSQLIAWLFVVAMVLLIAGLALFLWEIRLAVHALRVSQENMPHRRE